MYEEIRKPKMLQDVPISLIRPLPVLYYANKFAPREVRKRVQELYRSNLIYLGDALNKISYIINNEEFRDLSLSVRSLNQTISVKHLNDIQSMSIGLSRLCTRFKTELRKNSLEIKSTTMNLYAMQVDPLKILLVSMDQNPDNIKKVMGILRGFCQYHVDCSHHDNTDLSRKIVKTDFVIFSSISSPEIHEQVKKLDTYHIPGIALVPIDTKNPDPGRSVRHGSQLLKMGFPVLFRMFTPLRLFTTIEKTYLIHNLS